MRTGFPIVVFRYKTLTWRNKTNKITTSVPPAFPQTRDPTHHSIYTPVTSSPSSSSSSAPSLKQGSLLENGEHHGIIQDLKENAKECERNLTFCQFFFSKETRKLTLSCTFWKTCFSSILQFPIATPMHNTFFSWNLIIAFVSIIFASSDSWWLTRVGNFPALFKPGPNNRGICLMTDSDARKEWYFLASFFTSFLFLFIFFKLSTSMHSIPILLACCCAQEKKKKVLNHSAWMLGIFGINILNNRFQRMVLLCVCVCVGGCYSSFKS